MKISNVCRQTHSRTWHWKVVRLDIFAGLCGGWAGGEPRGGAPRVRSRVPRRGAQRPHDAPSSPQSRDWGVFSPRRETPSSGHSEGRFAGCGNWWVILFLFSWIFTVFEFYKISVDILSIILQDFVTWSQATNWTGYSLSTCCKYSELIADSSADLHRSVAHFEPYNLFFWWFKNTYFSAWFLSFFFLFFFFSVSVVQIN